MRIKYLSKWFLILSATALITPAIASLHSQTLQGLHPERPTSETRLNTQFQPLTSAEDLEGIHPIATVAVAGSVIIPAATPRQIASVPVIYGSVISSKAGADGSAANSKGMYSFDGTGNMTRLNTNGNAQYGGASMDNGYYYAITRSGTKTYIDKFLISTWKRSSHTSLTGTKAIAIKASDVAYDPTSDMVYGCFYNDAGDGYVFGRADYITRKREAIKPLSMSYNAVMVSPEGQVYAIDMTGTLYKVDKSTGETTTVGHTGVTPQYVTSGIIDPNTGRCFWTVVPASGKSYLYEVDLSTAQTTLIHEFAHSDEICGLYIPENAPAAEAPAAVSNLTTTFTEGALVGSVNFTLPTTTTGNGTLAGEIQYTLWIDGVIHTATKGNTGAEVTIPVTLPKAGNHTIVVRCDNTAGKGKRAKAKIFAGNDTPKAPTPTLTRGDKTFTISWAPVTASVNGGYIDTERLTYNVTRLPDNVLVGENITTTSFTDTVLPTPGRVIAYKYSVTATFEGNCGAAGETAPYPLGEIEAPWSEGFDNADALNNFIILDSNDDGVTWKYSSSMSSAYIISSSSKHDDWLITAAIRLQKGVNYKLAFEAMASFNPERIEVKMGKSPEPSAMTTTLVAATDLEANFSFNPNVPEFTVPESGLYYIGWHAISDANSFYLYLDNITLTDDANHDVDAITPPYLETFNESASLKNFTIVDANNDGFLWNIDNGEARVLNSETMNDWLISPPITMTAGNNYEISLYAHSYRDTGSPGQLEVLIGHKASHTEMDTVIIPVSNFNDPDVPVRLSNYYKAPADGNYYIAIHAMSSANGVYIDNFRVAAPVVDAAPAAPTNARITAAQYGELKATVSFKAPTMTVDGKTLSDITKIDVLLSDSIAHTFTSVQPGDSLECDITVPKAGTHNFAIVATNNSGAGIPVEISAYIGANIPNTPTDVIMTEEGNTGKVTLTWRAPRTDIEGNLLRTDNLKYTIGDVINGQTVLLARDITDTVYTVQAVAPGAAQQFKSYAVFASNEAGTGKGMTCNPAPVGKPEIIPWAESFANGATTNLIVNSVLQPQGQWNTFNDSFFSDVKSHDNDNGFAGFIGQNSGASGVLYTGKIDLGNVEKPELRFYVFNPYNDNSNEIMVQLLDKDGNAHVLLHKPLKEIGTSGWNRVYIPLKNFKNQTIRLAFATYLREYANSLLDDIRIGLNLAVSDITEGTTKVLTRTGIIDILGSEGVQVRISDIQGRIIYCATASGDLSIPVDAGVYIVNVSDKTYKVIVK